MSNTSCGNQNITREIIPKSLMRTVCFSILAVLCWVSYVTYFERVPSAIPPKGKVIQTQLINLDASFDGSVRITNFEGDLLADLTPEQGGFVSSIARTIKRKRVLSKSGTDGVVILTLDDLGRLRISDPLSGWSADLMSFGSNNSKTFARFFEK